LRAGWHPDHARAIPTKPVSEAQRARPQGGAGDDERRRHPSGFIAPCLPSRAAQPPSGPLWVHEIKHDGYRLVLCRDGARVRCFTRNGYDWADRFPAIVDAALALSRAQSFLIDGEAVIARADGLPDFRALRSRASANSARTISIWKHVILQRPM